MNNVENNNLPLGRRLRQITDSVNSKVEIDNLTKILVEAAERGQDRVQFDDLRLVIPVLSQSGKLNDWLQENEINIAGCVNQETAKWEYTLYW